jgi:hypothetical protein
MPRSRLLTRATTTDDAFRTGLVVDARVDYRLTSAIDHHSQARAREREKKRDERNDMEIHLVVRISASPARLSELRIPASRSINASDARKFRLGGHGPHPRAAALHVKRPRRLRYRLRRHRAAHDRGHGAAAFVEEQSFARGAPDAPLRPKSEREDWRQARPARAPASSPHQPLAIGFCFASWVAQAEA